MLEGKNRVLEIGAGDGVASALVQQFVGELTCTDIEAAEGVVKHDILSGPYGEGFDGVFSLDVLEHVEMFQTWTFLENMKDSLGDRGVCIIGTPSIESQMYASAMSKQYHKNCKTADALKKAMLDHFPNVFMFGMNDEVIHTGHEGMRHYNFAVGVK